MKKIFKILNVILFTNLIISCDDTNEYSIPEIELTTQELVTNSSITALKEMYNGSIIDFSNLQEDNLIIEGYVVSSDESGNIYKTLSIQDKPENPTAAIQISVDATDLYTFYEVGRKIYIKLNGLGLHENYGVLEIGEIEGANVNRISATAYKNHIIRSSEITTIIPKQITSIDNITTNNVNMLVQFNDMQSITTNETFANTTNTFSTNRLFKSCFNDETIIMRNSGYSGFKAQNIPEGKGSITAVLGSYFDTYQLYIRDTEDLKLTENRCDYETLNCESSNGTSAPIYEIDFENFTDIDEIIATGWSNINIKNNNELFELKNFGGNNYIQASGYYSGENPLEIWLISPSIDLENTINESFSFDTKTGFNNGAALTVWVSTDFTGNPSTANWTRINADFSDGPTDSYDDDFVDSGKISLSCLAGNVHIGFRYFGGNDSITTTFQIDNIKVTGEAL